MRDITLTMKRVLAAAVDFAFTALVLLLGVRILGYDFEIVFANALVANLSWVALSAGVGSISTWRWSSTPGQALLGLKVQNKDGSKLSFQKSLLRGLLVFVEGSLLGLPFYGLIYIAWGVNLLKLFITGKTFWDDQLGTIVVEKVKSKLQHGA